MIRHGILRDLRARGSRPFKREGVVTGDTSFSIMVAHVSE